MASNPSAPDKASALQSLLEASNAARQAYNAAFALNPADSNLAKLYQAELTTQNEYLTALNKTFADDGSATSIVSQISSITNSISNELNTIKNISTWVTVVDNLLQTAAKLATLFI